MPLTPKIGINIASIRAIVRHALLIMAHLYPCNLRG